MDSGVEDLNKDVEKLLEGGTPNRVIAQIDITFSNSMIESWWRSLTHGWSDINHLESMTTLRKSLEFYVAEPEHNEMMPHSAFDGQTPDEMHLGRGFLAGAITPAKDNIRRFAEDRGCSMNALVDFAGVSRTQLHAVLATDAAPTSDWLAEVTENLEVEPWQLLASPSDTIADRNCSRAIRARVAKKTTQISHATCAASKGCRTNGQSPGLLTKRSTQSVVTAGQHVVRADGFRAGSVDTHSHSDLPDRGASWSWSSRS
jgi:lambda repressor-like predicted transcriptional regulator